MAIQTHYGASDYFGHGDYYANRNRGYSNSEILKFINDNFHRFSPGPKNQPGAGGLYDMIGMAAMAENDEEKKKAELAARQQELNRIQSSFQSRMDSVNQQMIQQQQQYQQDLTQMKHTLTAQANPQTRESVLGVKGAGNDTSNTAKLNRQGMKGSFARAGLRIKSINV
tara:strand:- start:2906 stop:3412 length:507 start_codon:yes stop_codon:yes gene_type:complete